MKRILNIFPVLLICLLTSSVQAQTDIFIKITDASDATLTMGLSQAAPVNDGKGGKVTLTNYAGVTSLQFDQEQTVNIGSQGSGSATGKITFDPLTITKTVDAASAKLMISQAKGTLLKTVEILFVSTSGGANSGVSHKIVLKQAAVKSYSASFATDGESPTESISFDYGVLQVYTYTQNPTTYQYTENPYHYGWDRINSVSAQ